VFWSADDTSSIDALRFPNTWMALAVPLRVTFGIDVVNADIRSQDNFGQDAVLDPGSTAQVAACEHVVSFLVLDVATGGPSISDRFANSGISLDYLGEATGSMDFLSQPAEPMGWHRAQFSVTAWRVTVPPSLVPGDARCGVTTVLSAVAVCLSCGSESTPRASDVRLSGRSDSAIRQASSQARAT